MDLESWFVQLMDDITKAAYDGTTFDIHLENEAVKEIAAAYEQTKFIEIY